MPYERNIPVRPANNNVRRPTRSTNKTWQTSIKLVLGDFRLVLKLSRHKSHVFYALTNKLRD